MDERPVRWPVPLAIVAVVVAIAAFALGHGAVAGAASTTPPTPAATQTAPPTDDGTATRPDKGDCPEHNGGGGSGDTQGTESGTST